MLLEDDWKDGSKGILKFISRAYAQPCAQALVGGGVGARGAWRGAGARSHSAVWPAVRKCGKLIPLGVEMVMLPAATTILEKGLRGLRDR